MHYPTDSARYCEMMAQEAYADGNKSKARWWKRRAGNLRAVGKI